MFSICLRYTKNKEEAEDAFQQGFFLVYKNIKQLKDEKALSGWVKRIFVNAAIEQNRKSIQLRVLGDDELVRKNQTIETNDAIENMAIAEITALIQQLPVGCRTVFNLYVIDGFSHKEIAEKLNISVGTSKSQLHDARKTLKEKIIKNQLVAKSKTSQ